MVPKVENPTNSTKIRLIAYYTTIYKCMTKVICERIKLMLPWLAGSSQVALVTSKSILHNVLIFEDLIKLRNLRKVHPRCTSRWTSKKHMALWDRNIGVALTHEGEPPKSIRHCELEMFGVDTVVQHGFSPHFVKLIIKCTTSAKSSIKLNGSSGLWHDPWKLSQGSRALSSTRAVKIFSYVLSILWMIFFHSVNLKSRVLTTW